jgi:tetratricopeptide (TPR) repeat protein
MGDNARQYDVFLCYSWADSASAAALYAALDAEGLKVFQDVIDGEVYVPLGTSIREALDQSRTLVALMTPRLQDSPHCREELHIALSAAALLDDRDIPRVMAVVQDMSPDEVRPRELTRFRLPRTGALPPELPARIARIARQHQGRFGDSPDLPDPAWHPKEIAGDKRFRGRWDELWEIRHGLTARSRNADRGHPVVVVSGPGGFGKTALCLQYARWFPRDHPGGVFLLGIGGSGGGLDDSAVRAVYRRQLALVADSLALSGPDEVAPALAEAGRPYLWIVDDLPATASPDLIADLCAPTAAGRTLMSTRGRVDSPASSVLRLAPLGTAIGGRVLTSRRPAPSAEQQAVQDIVRLLDGHPLGLTLASGLSALPAFGGYQELLAELSSSIPDHLEAVAAGMVDELPTGCARPFASSLLRSFASMGSATRDALTAASVLAPTFIPYSLLASITGGPVDARTLEPAADRGLVASGGTGGCLMHALVARAIRIRTFPAAVRSDLRDAALGALTEAVESTRDHYRHAEIAYYLPHVRAAAGLFPGGDSWRMAADERYLLNETGRVQIEAGRGGDALDLLKALHEACADAPDVDIVTRHAIAVALAAAHTEQGNHTIALGLLEQAAAAFDRELGADHQDALTVRHNLALACLRLGRPEQAHAMLQEVYRARRDWDRLGPQHRDTLKALCSLAIARGHLGTTADERIRHRRVALRYWGAARERWLRVARPDDHYALDILNGLALCYRSLGMLEQARETLADLQRRRELLLGRGHPASLDAAENSMIVRRELGEPPDEGFVAVLLSRLQSQGPGHYQTGRTMANLIGSLRQPDGHPADSGSLVQADSAPGGVRLDGDHVDQEIDLLLGAIDYQQECVDRFGSDDHRTLMAACYLAYALTADHVDGQLESACAIIEDTWPAVADAADTGDLDMGCLQIAMVIRDWLRELAGNYEA